MAKYTPEQVLQMATQIKATSKDPVALAAADRAIATAHASSPPMPGAAGRLPTPEQPSQVGAVEAGARSLGEGFIPGLHNLMGVGNTIGEYLGGKLTDAPVKKDLDTSFMQEADKPREDLAAAKAQHPWVSMAGDIAGTGLGLVGTGAGLLSRGVTNTVEHVAPRLAETSLGKVAVAAAGGAASGAGMEAVKSAGEGEDAGGIVDRARRGAKGGAVFGAVANSLGQGVDAANTANMGSQGYKARQLLENSGAKVGPLSIDTKAIPEIDGVKSNDSNIAALSRNASANAINTEEQSLSKNMQPHLEAKGALDSGAGGDEKVVVNDLHNQLVKLSTDGSLTDAQQATIKKWIDGNGDGTGGRIEKWALKDAEGKPTGVYAMPARELNKFRQMIDGQLPTDPGTVSERAMGGAAEAARKAVDETQYAGPNAGIHAARNEYEANRTLLGLPEKPQSGGVRAPENRDLSEAEVAHVANMVTRNGHDTSTVGVRNRLGAVPGGDTEAPVGRVDEYLKARPEMAQQFAAPGLLNARGDLEYKLLDLSHKGGLKAAVHGVGTGLGGLGAIATASGSLHSPLLTGATALAGLASQNIAPIQGRLLPPALNGSSALLSNPASAAMMEDAYRQAIEALNKKRR